ncbi:MAG: hypothetical protein KDI15_13645, partial [Thiothrix sp.]|nr:hypothetical protein [Thiothrix sp.]
MVMFYVQSLFWLLLALLLGYLLGRWIKGLICRRREQALPPRMEDAGEVSVQRAAVGAADRAGLYTGRAADDTARGTAATGSLSGTDAAIPVVRAERREPPAAAEGLKPGTEAGLAAGAAAGLAGMAAAVHTGRAEAAETAETGTGDVAQRVIPASGSI